MDGWSGPSDWASGSRGNSGSKPSLTGLKIADLSRRTLKKKVLTQYLERLTLSSDLTLLSELTRLFLRLLQTSEVEALCLFGMAVHFPDQLRGGFLEQCLERCACAELNPENAGPWHFS